MSSPSIPDRAALLIAKSAEVEKSIERIRAVDGEWTGFKLLVSEAMNTAADGLIRGWSILDRVHALVDNEAAHLEGNKS